MVLLCGAGELGKECAGSLTGTWACVSLEASAILLNRLGVCWPLMKEAAPFSFSWPATPLLRSLV